MKKTSWGMLLIGLSACLFSLQSILSQACYRTGFSILSLLTGRYILAILLLGLWCLCRRIPLFLPAGQRRIGIAMGLLSAATIALLFTAFASLPAAVAILCYYAYPAFTILWCRIFWKRQVGYGQLLALILSITGVTLLSLDGLSNGLSVQGAVCAFGSALTMSIQIMLMERYMPTVNKMSYNLTAFLVALVVFAPILLLREGISWVSHIQPEGIFYLILLVLLATIGCNLLLTYGMESVSAPTAAILNTLEIPCTALFAFVFFGDKLTWPQLVGGSMILLAIVLPTWLERRNHSQKSTLSSKNP